MAFGNNVGSPSTYVNQNTGDAILKEWYSDEGITNEIYVENPWLALIPKKEDVTGRFYNQPIAVSSGQGRSRSFTQAQLVAQTAAGSNATFTSGEALFDFQVKKIENHAVANVSTQLVEESSTSKGAFLDMVKLIPDNQLKNFANDTALAIFRGTDCSRGNVGGSVAGTILTLANPSDAINFNLGMWLDFATASGGVSTTFASVAAAYCQVIAIDRIAGSMTVAFSSGTNTLTANSVAVGNFIYQSGDKSLGLNGFTDWIPYGGVASNDSFLGVNRSFDSSQLAGNYLDGTGGQLEEVLEAAIAQTGRFGSRLTHNLMPYGVYRQLAQAQGAKVQLINVQATPRIGFSGVEVVGYSGTPVVCLPDRNCPPNLIAGVNKNSWKMISVGKAVKVWQLDGKVWLRSQSQSGMEVRFYSLTNIACSEPRANVNIRINPSL